MGTRICQVPLNETFRRCYFYRHPNSNTSRHLAAEIIVEYQDRTEKEISTEEIRTLALELTQFFLKHNAEADACDLLLELEYLDILPEYVDKDTYQRVCLYILRCAKVLR